MITREHIDKGRTYRFEYTEMDSFDSLTDLPVRQVRAVTLCDDKFVIVANKRNIWGHPGGTLEPGESIEEALKREIIEETGCTVIWWKPLGVQKVTDESGKAYYQVRVVCEATYGEFHGDPAEGITDCKHVEKDKILEYVQWHNIGDAMLKKSYEIIDVMHHVDVIQ